MFPWQGEGKGTSFLLATQQREQRQQQAQQQQATQQQPQSARQDNGYGRWRLPSVMQGTSQAVNGKISSSHTSSDVPNGRAPSSSNREEVLAGPESISLSASVDDDEEDEEEEDGDAEQQGDSEGEDIDYRSSRTESNPNGTTKNGTEKQATRQPGQRPGERTPPLGYPPQPSFRNNHARRLNTEEEIKLFELCIKHSSTFGERSKLCEWWKNIANEFIENYGGPYSWHSVRRKVDLVTRQRIKYLADLKEGKIETDQATDPWKRVLDEWIPTWEKFEVSEKRRIEVRDQRAAMRKRKEPPSSVASGVAAEGSNPSSPAPSSSTPAAKRKSTGATPSAGAGAPGSWQATPSKWTPGPSPYGPSPYAIPAGPMAQPPPSTPGMKMPDGYDTMFRNSAHPITHPLYPYHPPQPYFTPPMAAPTAADNNLTSAVLETLTKLNKHLEKADGTSSPIVAALTAKNSNKTIDKPIENGTSSPQPHADAEDPKEPPPTTIISAATTLQKFKTELRAEFEMELAKLREAFTAKLDALEQTQEMIMDMLRQEPGREGST